MSLTIEQVRIYIKAVDSGRIEKRPLDGMQGLARLAIAQDEENRRLREALAWYADAANWIERYEGTVDYIPSNVGEDDGDRARAALSAAEAPAGRDT